MLFGLVVSLGGPFGTPRALVVWAIQLCCHIAWPQKLNSREIGQMYLYLNGLPDPSTLNLLEFAAR